MSMFGHRQLGITPRLRFAEQTRAVSLGLGLSTGTSSHHGYLCFLSCSTETWEGAVWLNPELAVEKRYPATGTSVRWLFGVQVPTKGGVYRCTGSCTQGPPPMPPVMPYIGVALGWAALGG
jgi:hypothetical protein